MRYIRNNKNGLLYILSLDILLYVYKKRMPKLTDILLLSL